MFFGWTKKKTKMNNTVRKFALCITSQRTLNKFAGAGVLFVTSKKTQHYDFQKKKIENRSIEKVDLTK